jgi:hypothetical protein
MKLETELVKLIETLKIPIDSIHAINQEFVLLLGGYQIGVVPYFIVKNEIHFETAEKVLNYINWSYIFNKYRNEITAKIGGYLNLEVDSVNVINLNFRRLQVENKNNSGTFSFFYCEFIGDEWQVFIENKD